MGFRVEGFRVEGPASNRRVFKVAGSGGNLSGVDGGYQQMMGAPLRDGVGTVCFGFRV